MAFSNPLFIVRGHFNQSDSRPSPFWTSTPVVYDVAAFLTEELAQDHAQRCREERDWFRNPENAMLADVHHGGPHGHDRYDPRPINDPDMPVWTDVHYDIIQIPLLLPSGSVNLPAPDDVEDDVMTLLKYLDKSPTLDISDMCKQARDILRKIGK